jgi:triacylglycerol lipase
MWVALRKGILDRINRINRMMPIDTTRSSFSWANARACLERSAIAYLPNPFDAVNDPTRVVVENAQSNARAVVFDEKHCISVAFRGSQSPEDFIHDGECWFSKTGKRRNAFTAMVHHGFLFDFESISKDLLATMARLLLPHPRKKIVITGHSLGGALAILFARACCWESWNVAGVYTFGQPRVGNATFVSAYENMRAGFPRTLGAVTYRVVNENDIVPRVPLALGGYRHGGEEKFLCAPNGVLTNPHWWETMGSDLAGFSRALLKRTDVLVGDHYLNSYKERIKNL